MKLRNIYLKKWANNMNLSLNDLNLDKSIINKLLNNNIESLDKLWTLNRKKLKELNFNYNEINAIAIKLQLNGLDFNKKRNVK